MYKFYRYPDPAHSLTFSSFLYVLICSKGLQNVNFTAVFADISINSYRKKTKLQKITTDYRSRTFFAF